LTFQLRSATCNECIFTFSWPNTRAKRTGFQPGEKPAYAVHDVFTYPSNFKPWTLNYTGNGLFYGMLAIMTFSIVILKYKNNGLQVMSCMKKIIFWEPEESEDLKSSTTDHKIFYVCAYFWIFYYRQIFGKAWIMNLRFQKSLASFYFEKVFSICHRCK
jgi:hypothetical protein